MVKVVEKGKKLFLIGSNVTPPPESINRLFKVIKVADAPIDFSLFELLQLKIDEG